MIRACFYHPEQNLHNFCLAPQCALPLCPKCIHIHLASSQPHHILSLNEVSQMLNEQISTSIKALSHQIQQLLSECSAEGYLLSYKSMLDKYRMEAIQDINSHFNLLEKQLLVELSNKFNRNLGNFMIPLQESLKQVQKFEVQLKSNQRLDGIIRLISQQKIVEIQKLLQQVETRKDIMMSELPKLKFDSNGVIRMYPTMQKTLPNTITRSVPLSQKNTERRIQNPIDKILSLENKLYTMRVNCQC